MLSAIAIVAALATSLPATADFIAFMKIEKTSLLGIRFDYVFSVYLIFAVALIGRYLLRAVVVLRGGDPDRSPDAAERDSGQ